MNKVVLTGNDLDLEQLAHDNYIETFYKEKIEELN